MQHERKWMQNQRNMRGNECKVKSDERKWKQQVTSVDSRPRMLSHPLLVYRELTTWENDESKNDIMFFWWLKKIRFFFIHPHMLLAYTIIIFILSSLYPPKMGYTSPLSPQIWWENPSTLWLFNIAMENHQYPFLIGETVKPSINGPWLPWLC